MSEQQIQEISTEQPEQTQATTITSEEPVKRARGRPKKIKPPKEPKPPKPPKEPKGPRVPKCRGCKQPNTTRKGHYCQECFVKNNLTKNYYQEKLKKFKQDNTLPEGVEIMETDNGRLKSKQTCCTVCGRSKEILNKYFCVPCSQAIKTLSQQIRDKIKNDN